MNPQDFRKRREWFLPLVGGAEINRIQNKAPDPLYFTSRPYPTEVLDSLTSGVRMRNTNSADVIDFLAAATSFIGGEMRTPLHTYNMGVDNLTSRSAVISGVLRSIQQVYAVPFESVRPVTVLSGGVLRVILVQYTRWPVENLRPLTTFIGGTLT